MPQLGDGYLAALNIKRRFVLPVSPPPPTPPLPPAAHDEHDHRSSDPWSAGATVGVVLGAVGFAALLLLAAALAAWLVKGRTHRRWGLFGQHLAPGVGPNTTLVVTDIENSTLLWCVLPRRLPWSRC